MSAPTKGAWVYGARIEFDYLPTSTAPAGSIRRMTRVLQRRAAAAVACQREEQDSPSGSPSEPPRTQGGHVHVEEGTEGAR